MKIRVRRTSQYIIFGFRDLRILAIVDQGQKTAIFTRWELISNEKLTVRRQPTSVLLTHIVYKHQRLYLLSTGTQQCPRGPARS